MWYSESKFYLLTVDFEKAFDSLNHTFSIAVFKKYGFGKDFIDWIKIWLKAQWQIWDILKGVSSLGV